MALQRTRTPAAKGRGPLPPPFRWRMGYGGRMCGIAGIFSASRIDRSVLEGMTRAIAHRGPDDSGLWIDEEVGVGLGHRRLSIVDLSPAGHQPMRSWDG